MPFDPDSHFTMKALDRLEYIGIINLNNLESDTKQLNDVVGIKATDLTYINLSSLLEMWIEGHASLDPTWRHLFWALREAKLSHFANQIESYLNGVVAEQETSNLDPNTDREASERGGEGECRGYPCDIPACVFYVIQACLGRTLIIQPWLSEISIIRSGLNLIKCTVYLM